MQTTLASAASSAHPPGLALGPFLAATPVWVWGLLAALLVLGYTQTRRRQASLLRVALMPAAMTAFSLWGLVSHFAATRNFELVATAWAVVATTVLGLVAAGAPTGQYDPATRRFSLPGSWVPMALILSVFSLNYAANVALALQPGLVHHVGFGLGLGAASGLFAGVFTGRAARVLKLAMGPAGPVRTLTTH